MYWQASEREDERKSAAIPNVDFAVFFFLNRFHTGPLNLPDVEQASVQSSEINPGFPVSAPAEQQGGALRHQRHRCGHALLRRHLPVRGHRPRAARGWGRKPQPRSLSRQRQQRTKQGGGVRPGAGLPHPPGAVSRTPPLEVEPGCSEGRMEGSVTGCKSVFFCLSCVVGPRGGSRVLLPEPVRIPPEIMPESTRVNSSLFRSRDARRRSQPGSVLIGT